MIKNKSKIISRFRAGLASLCLVSSTITVPYANASILLDSKVISPVTTDMDTQGSYGIDPEGRLVFCDPEQAGCTYHQGGSVKQLLSSDDIRLDDHWRYLLTQNGDVWIAPWDDTGIESATKIATNVKQMRLAGGDSNLIYFRTKDDTISAYHLRTDTYHYHPEQYPLLSKILDFDVSSPLGVALNDAGDVVLWNVNAIAGGISYMFQTVKPPEGKTLVNVAVGGVAKGGSTSIYALDQEGYLYRFNYEFTGSSFETESWTPVALGVRFTDIESGNGLSQSGRIWSLSLLPGEVDNRYYWGKGDEHPWYNPRVFTEIWGEDGTSSYMEAVGRYWATSGYNKRDSCLSLSEEVYFSHEDCIFTPYDGIHTENPGVVYTHPSVIVPNKPSVREKCGELPTVIVPPDTDKVRYERTQEGNKVTVNAYPKAGYVMTSQSSWSYTLTPSAPCPVVSATASPTPTPTVTPTVEVPAPTTSTKPSVFPMTTVTAPPSPTTSLPPIPLHTGTFTTSKPSSTKPAVPVETVVASTSTPVVTKPVLEPTPIAEPTPTSEPAGFQFKPWYLLAGLAPLVALPALLPKPVSNVVPVTTPPVTSSTTVSSLSPTTSVSPTTVSQSKAKGIVSGVTAYENRGWLVLVGVLLIAVCSALFVSRRQEGKK